MPRLARTALVSLCTAAALAAAPAADAAAHARHATKHHTHDTRSASTGPHSGPSHTLPLAHAQTQVLRDVRRLDSQLAKLSTGRGLTGLGADDAAVVRQAVAADRAALAAVAATIATATSPSDLRAAAATLRLVRPEVYQTAVADLRAVSRLTDQVTANAAALAAVTDRDVTAGVTADDAAAAALADAHQQALALTASSTRQQLRGVRAALVAARQALGQVEDVLAGGDGTEDGTTGGDPGGDAGGPPGD